MDAARLPTSAATSMDASNVAALSSVTSFTNPTGATKKYVPSILSSFSIFNVHGLRPQTVPSKVPYVSDILLEKNQLFMAITETWLLHHTDAELSIDGYKLFRSDRKRAKKSTKGRLSGGAGCYVRSDIAPTMEIMINFSNGVVELLGLYSKVKNLFYLCDL